MDIAALQGLYREGRLKPSETVEHIYRRIAQEGERPVWISLVPREEALERARQLERDGAGLALYGVPFAVKDNFDVAGMTTTAGCPAFGYPAAATAPVVQRLIDAGAILIGKTNMDQFATGLSGTRSPYGVCSSAFSRNHISGGSSSGSAVAVAQGLVSFSLGTDTAGSGRVPAALNQLVGLKPTRGLLSARGVVPACRSLDCVSIFAETSADAARVLAVASAFDPEDAYSRISQPPELPVFPAAGSFRFGIPFAHQLEFFGDEGSAVAYARAVAAMQSLGGEAVEFDLAPFRDAAELLYCGPWVAERLAAIEPFLRNHQAEMDPTVAKIVAGADRYRAVDVYRSIYRLEELRKITSQTWNDIDVLLLPTVPRTYTIDQMQASPIELNTNLGHYTNFVNLLDLAAVAVPAGTHSGALPFGVSLIAPAFSDLSLLRLADRLHRCFPLTLGASERLLAETPSLEDGLPEHWIPVAVVGAHLAGQPLHWQLTERRGRLLAATKTGPEYRLFSLANTTPAKPGLLYEPGFQGPGIEVEVWALPSQTVGSFLALVPRPLAIGTLQLADGTLVKGFVCEGSGLEGAEDITHFGSWRKYRATL